MSLLPGSTSYDDDELLAFALSESDRADARLSIGDDEGATILMMGVAEAALAAKRLPFRNG